MSADNDKTKDPFDITDDDFATISMIDESGEEVEFLVVSSVESDGINYLLVMESDLIDEDEAEAIILKEVTGDGEEAFFAVVEDEAEFMKAAGLFKNSNDDYDIEV